MIFTGDTQEYIELSILEENNHKILKAKDSSSLSVLWFESDGNELVIDGKEYFFGRNQIIFLTEFHHVEMRHTGKIRYLRFNRPFYCVIDHDVEVSCRGLLFFGASQLPNITIPEDELDHLLTLWKMFAIEMHQKDNLQISMLQMMLKRYLILCTRYYKVQHDYPEIEVNTDLIREFNFLVEKYFKVKHTVNDYAELMNKSPKTLSNVFAKLGSKSPLHYIHNRKMLEARRLLRYSSKQIKEITYEIGFEDLQTFSRFFKNIEGVSPSEYKNNLVMG